MAEPVRNRRRLAQGRRRHRPSPCFVLAWRPEAHHLPDRRPDDHLGRPPADPGRIVELGRQRDCDLRLDSRLRSRPAADRPLLQPSVLPPLQRVHLPRPDDADRGHADARLRARRRGLGRAPAGRARSGRGQAGGQPRRHALAERRGLRAGRRKARARPAVPRPAGHRQDDAGQGDRDGLQLSVRAHARLGLPADVPRHGRGHRPLARAQGEEARPEMGRPVHRLHRRDRRGRNAEAGSRRRSELHRRPSRGRAVLRALRGAEPHRRHDSRDARLARSAVCRAREQAHGPDRARAAVEPGRRFPG